MSTYAAMVAVHGVEASGSNSVLQCLTVVRTAMEAPRPSAGP